MDRAGEHERRIAAQLAGGKAAVGVLAEPYQVAAISDWLVELGGTTEVHEVAVESIAEGDDLTIIDGVGPAIADALRSAAVTTIAQLGGMTPEAIEALLAKANVQLVAGHNAAWPHQARLAAAQDWSALRRCIDPTKQAWISGSAPTPPGGRGILVRDSGVRSVIAMGRCPGRIG